jgi:hypothetical protein
MNGNDFTASSFGISDSSIDPNLQGIQKEILIVVTQASGSEMGIHINDILYKLRSVCGENEIR